MTFGILANRPHIQKQAALFNKQHRLIGFNDCTPSRAKVQASPAAAKAPVKTQKKLAKIKSHMAKNYYTRILPIYLNAQYLSFS